MSSDGPGMQLASGPIGRCLPRSSSVNRTGVSSTPTFPPIFHRRKTDETRVVAPPAIRAELRTGNSARTSSSGSRSRRVSTYWPSLPRCVAHCDFMFVPNGHSARSRNTTYQWRDHHAASRSTGEGARQRSPQQPNYPTRTAETPSAGPTARFSPNLRKRKIGVE